MTTPWWPSDALDAEAELPPAYEGVTPIPLEERWQRVKQAPPAAGALPASLPIAGDFYRMIAGVFTVFTTDANVANRQVSCQILDADANIIMNMGNGLNQAATNSFNYTYGLGLPALAVSSGGVVSAGLPLYVLFPGMSVRLRVANIQAGDLFTTIQWTFLCRPTTVDAIRIEEPISSGEAYDTSEEVYP